MLQGEGISALRQLSSEELCSKLRETGKSILGKVADIFEEQELDGEDLTSIIYEELCVVLPKLGMRLKLESFLDEMGITITLPKILPEVEESPRKKRKLEFTSASNSNELDKKLWIRGVPKEKNNIAQISMFFSTFGNIENLQIMREQKGAVLQFSSAEEVTNCIEDCSNEVIMGERSIRLERYITFEEEGENKKTDTLEEVTEDASIAEEPMEELEEAKSTESVNRVSNKYLVEKAIPSETTGCPGKHELRTYIATDRSRYYTCSACSKTIAQVFGCRICDWDICPSCLPADKRVRRSNQASTVWCPSCLSHAVNHNKEPSTRISIVDFSTSIKASSDDKHRCDLCEHIEFDDHREFIEHISSVAHRLRVSLKLSQDPLLHEYMCKICPKKKNAFRQMTTPATWQTHLLGNVHRAAADKYKGKILTTMGFVRAYGLYRANLPEGAYQPTAVVFSDKEWKPEDDKESSDDDIFDFSDQGENESDDGFELMSDDSDDSQPTENVEPADPTSAKKVSDSNSSKANQEKIKEKASAAPKDGDKGFKKYGTGICWSFQRGNCRRKSCFFPHSCALCSSPRHGAKMCPKNKKYLKNVGKQKAAVVKPSPTVKVVEADEKGGNNNRKKRKLNSSGAGEPICWKYQKGTCQIANCGWPHLCQFCNKAGHGAWKCPEKKKKTASDMRLKLKRALVQKLSKEHKVSVKTMNRILEAAEQMRRSVYLEGLPRCQSNNGLQALVSDLKEHIRKFSEVEPDQLKLRVELLSSVGRVILNSTSHDKVFKVAEALNGLLLKPDFVVSARKDSELSHFLPEPSERALFTKLSPILVKIYPKLLTPSISSKPKSAPTLPAKGTVSAPVSASKEKPVFSRARKLPPPPIPRNAVFKGEASHGGASGGYTAVQRKVSSRTGQQRPAGNCPPAPTPVSARSGALRHQRGGYQAVQTAVPVRSGAHGRTTGGYRVVQPRISARPVAQGGAQRAYPAVQPTVPAHRGVHGGRRRTYPPVPSVPSRLGSVTARPAPKRAASGSYPPVQASVPARQAKGTSASTLTGGVQQALPYVAPVAAPYQYPIGQAVPQHVVPVYRQGFAAPVYPTQTLQGWQPWGGKR